MSEALRKAAQTLSDAIRTDRHDWDDWPEDSRNALATLRAALAEPEQSEPVAWMDADGNFSDNNDYGAFSIPLYAAPPRREPSDE